MIVFNTENPSALLAKFDAAITKHAGVGSITTWIKKDGGYTHAAAEWTCKAYFDAHIEPGRLRFNIIKNVGSDIKVVVYGYYHRHLLETFLNHFDRDFSGVFTSPLCEFGDVCATA